MELSDFEACRNCKKINNCKKPCQKFFRDEKMNEIDRNYWISSLRVDLTKQIEGDTKTKEFKRLKKEFLTKISPQQIIQYATEEEGFGEGVVIQKTENFIAIRREELKYIRVINFLDVYTKNVTITGY